MGGDLGVGHAVHLGQQEDPFRLRRQAVQQAVQFHQGFQDDGACFLTRRFGLRQRGQGLEVGAFDILAPVMVGQYAFGHRGEEGSGLEEGRLLPGQQYTEESVLRQVGGILRAAQAAAQPAGQPTVVIAVQLVQGFGPRGRKSVGAVVQRQDPEANRNASHSIVTDRISAII
ncbi:hypothetical protein D3C76_898200 [compost metagenome]